MSTLQKLKDAGKVVLDLDLRKNSLLDQSGNSNDATASGASASWVNTPHGRGYKTHGTGKLTVADSAELQLTEGYLLVFGDFERQETNCRLLYKRDGGGTNYDFYVPNTTHIDFYDGASGSNLTVAIIGKKMLGVKFKSGSKPEYFVDGVNVGRGASVSTVTVDNADLYIGNDNSGGNPLENTLTKVVILNDSTISEEDIQNIYLEYMQERGALEIPTRGYSGVQEEDTDSTLELHYDMKSLTGDGKMADLSGNGRHGIITAPVVTSPSVFGEGRDFTGLGYIAVPYADIGTTITYEIWIKPIATTNAQLLSYMSTLLRYSATQLLWFPDTGGPQKAISNYNLIMNKWNQIILSQTGTVYSAYLNNALVVSADGGLAVDNADASNYIGRYSGTIGVDSHIASVKMYSSEISSAKRAELYAEGAKKLNFSQSMEDIPPTLANLTAAEDRIGLTDFKVSTGQWKVSEDSNGKKWIENVADGICYMESTQAYGTWIWDFYKDSGGTSQVYFHMLADTIGAEDATGQDGYNIFLHLDESLYLRESATGAAGTKTTTATSYVALATKYSYAVTRRYDGSFTQYIKGGAYTDWQLTSMTGGYGNNPTSDNTTTTSKYVLLNLDAGDKISDIRFHEGVLTLAQLNEMY